MMKINAYRPGTRASPRPRVTGAVMSCRCDAGYTGQHCDKKDYSVLYVVPGPVRFQYVLIAAVIGTVQIAVICVVVLCITRSVLRLPPRRWQVRRRPVSSWPRQPCLHHRGG